MPTPERLRPPPIAAAAAGGARLAPPRGCAAIAAAAAAALLPSSGRRARTGVAARAPARAGHAAIPPRPHLFPSPPAGRGAPATAAI